MQENRKRPIILQQFSKKQINNGGPATGAKLLINSFLKEKYQFEEMSESFLVKDNPFKQFWYFYRTIRSVKPDVVHIRGVQSEGFFGVLAAKLLGYRVVLSVHGLAFDSIGCGKLKKYLFKHIFESYALKNADLVYCVCKYAADRKYIKDNTKHLYGYIHNAAPSYDLSNCNKEREEKRNELYIGEKDIIFTYVGRVTIDKGIQVLMDAFSEIIPLHNNIKLCIVGDGNYIYKIKKEYQKLIIEQKLILLGKISDVKNVLLASDVFVFPTLHENLSNALLEAAYVGLPIIATQVGGNTEVICNGKSGIIVEPNNVEQLKKAILDLLNNTNLRKKLGEEVMSKIKNEYSQEYIFAQISKAYDSLLN